jgi:6-phosphogluconolactonase
MPDFRVLDDLPAIANAAADEFFTRAKAAIAEHGRFTVALSGGSTPKALHGVIVERSQQNPRLLDWSNVEVFFGDERHVPPDHPDSNFRMANETLLSKVPIPPANVHRIPCEITDAAQVAIKYDDVLSKLFQLEDRQFPRFDLILLGMGPDGHTASLFPGTKAVHEQGKRVVPNWVPKLDTWRVTFTFPTINRAACVLLMIAGNDKAPALQEVRGQGSPEVYPVKYVKPVDGELIWMVSKSALGQ